MNKYNKNNNVNENEKVNFDNNENNMFKKYNNGELFKKENIEQIKKEDIFDEKVCILEKNEKNLYLSMFKKYLTGEKYQYFDLYIDIYTKKINSIIRDNIIIFKNSDIQK